MTEDPDTLVKQKIVDVLVTRSFERPTIPEYGAGLYDFVFDNLDDLIIADFRMDASRELQSRVSGVSIVDIGIEPREPGEYAVTVFYQRAMAGVSKVTVTLDFPELLNEESIIL